MKIRQRSNFHFIFWFSWFFFYPIFLFFDPIFLLFIWFSWFFFYPIFLFFDPIFLLFITTTNFCRDKRSIYIQKLHCSPFIYKNCSSYYLLLQYYFISALFIIYYYNIIYFCRDKRWFIFLSRQKVIYIQKLQQKLHCSQFIYKNCIVADIIVADIV